MKRGAARCGEAEASRPSRRGSSVTRLGEDISPYHPSPTYIPEFPATHIKSMAPATSASPRAPAAAVIVKEHAALAVAASMVPVPFLEFAAVSAVHLTMIEELTREYGIEFSPQLAKAILATTFSGYAAYHVDAFVTASVAKFIPGLGSFFAMVTLPSIAGGLTYALGRVFIRHFEQGGSLLDFGHRSAQPGFLQELERSRANPAELAQVPGSRAATSDPR